MGLHFWQLAGPIPNETELPTQYAGDRCPEIGKGAKLWGREPEVPFDSLVCVVLKSMCVFHSAGKTAEDGLLPNAVDIFLSYCFFVGFLCLCCT